MPTKPLDRLMFAQGGLCFFCGDPLPQNEASVEHLVASANGGGNGDENCVACCKTLNAMFASMALKEKIKLVLNQRGSFRCPNKSRPQKAAVVDAVIRASTAHVSLSDKIARIVSDLRKRGSARPRTVKTLSSTITALFQRQISEIEVACLIERLRTEGFVVVTGTKVSYELSTKVA
jgi:hypothetical protein